MGLMVMIDINGQRLDSAIPMARYLEVSPEPVSQVVICGAPGGVSSWKERFDRHFGASDRVHAISVSNRKEEATVRLSAEATRLALSDPGSLQDHWLIISRREGFVALVEMLKAMGASRAEWVPMVSNDWLASLMPEGAQVGDAIREVASRLLEKQGGDALLIGALANTVTDLLPELRSAEHREHLFGSRRFKAICVALGLNVKGDYIVPVAHRDR
jgi:hypothetical protein